jgi:hypothetical protein
MEAGLQTESIKIDANGTPLVSIVGREKNG